MSPLDDDDLDRTEQLLSGVGTGIGAPDEDPLVRLLQAARGPATDDELVDSTHFAERVAADALLGAHPAVEPHHRGRRSPAGRAVAVKTAVVAAIGVFGLAGAAAASGLIVNDPPASTTSTPTVSAPTAESEPTTTADEPTSTLPTTAPSPPTGPAVSADSLSPPAPGSDAATAGPATPPVVPGANGAANGNSPQAGGNPDPGSNGATNGNSPNAGGNPDPGSNGAAHGNSPQAGGNPARATLGDPGAVNGNGADRSGVPVENA